MSQVPKLMFVIDTQKEINAVREARKLKIPIVGLIDTNADPNEVDIAIPANDDAMRAVTLFCKMVADACLDGKAKFLEGKEIEAAAAAAAAETATTPDQVGGEESVA
jgi:small subunit ribosomal protein S2